MPTYYIQTTRGHTATPPPPPPVPPLVPAMVQYVAKARSYGGSGPWSVAGFIYLRLPSASLTGNTLVVWLRCPGIGSIANITVIDDHSNTWVRATDVYNSTGDVELMSFYCIGAAAGTRLIKIQQNFSTGLFNPQVQAAEFCGITGIDTSSTNSGSSATQQAGSATPTVTGDLVCFCGVRSTSLTTTSITAGSQSNITWKLMGPNIFNGHSMQWGIYNSTAALNAQMTCGSTSDYCAGALFFKTGISGTARPTGMRIVGVNGIDYRPGDFSIPQTIQFSAYGNLRVISHVGGVAATAPTITNVTESGDATWATCGAGVVNDSRVGMWYGANGSEHTEETVTVTFNISSGDCTLQCYDIQGADVAPLDTFQTATGNQAVAGNLTALTITPGISSGMTIANLGVAFNTVQDPTSPTGALFDQCFVDGFSTTGPVTPDENNGWAHCSFATSAAQVWTWTQLVGGTAFEDWAAFATTFKAG